MPATTQLNNPAAGTVFSHTPDCRIEWVIPALPSSGNVTWRFREIDANNHIRVILPSTGLITISRLLAGSATASLGGTTFAPGDVMTIFAQGASILFYRNGLLVQSGTTAILHETASNGSIVDLAGGSIGDLSFHTVELDDWLTHHWKLNETSGTRLDSIGASHLTDNNTVLSEPGMVGNAATFVAASLEALSTTSPVFPSESAWTISCWVKLSAKVSCGLVTKRSNSGRTHGLQYNATTDRFTSTALGSGGGGTIVSSDAFGALSVGVWYHVVAWYRYGSSGISVNGVANEFANIISGASGHVEFVIGRVAGSTGFASAAIDDVRTWSRAISAFEREQVYANRLGDFTAFPELDAYDTYATSSNPLARWKMDETSGNRVDVAGTHILTDLNTVTSALGKVGNAASFLAANSEAFTIPIASATDFEVKAARDFAISMWVKPTTTSGTLVYNGVPTGGAGQQGYWFLNSANTLITRFSDGSAGYVQTTIGSAFTLNAWNHLLVNFDRDGLMETYVNNVLKAGASISAQQGGAAATWSFMIGASISGAIANFFSGLIDEVMFWPRLIDATERARLYNTALNSLPSYVPKRRSSYLFL